MHAVMFIIVVADQDGDVAWDLKPTLHDAIDRAKVMQETAFDKPKIYQIDGMTLQSKEREWH